MKTKKMLLVVSGLSAIVLSAALTQADDLRSLVVSRPIGSLRVQQELPAGCGGALDRTLSVVGGRIEMTPTEGVGVEGDKIVQLTGLSLFFSPFSIRLECLGLRETRNFSEIGVRLASPVSLAVQRDGSFTIPMREFLLYESVIDNRQPEASYRRPAEDVTGRVDLERGTVQFHVVLRAAVEFRAGCVGSRCIVDGTFARTETADVAGAIVFPDTDTDGVPDRSDSCPLVSNPDQAEVATPVVTAPPDLTLHSCRDRRISMANGIDVCSARPVRVTNDAPSAFAFGPNRVTWSGQIDESDPVTDEQIVTLEPISCTPTNPTGRSFQVSAADDCGLGAIHLGDFTLANGEVIQIQETGQPGIRLVGRVGADRIRHFQVGRGEAVVTATDAAGNVARTVCQ